MQTRLDSFIESVINIFIGYAVAVASQLLVFPLFNIHVSFTDNLLIGLYFTAISLVRSYAIRRFFNHKNKQQLA